MSVRRTLFFSLLAAAAAAGRLRASHPSFHTGDAAALSGATHKITCIQAEISRAVVARDDIVAVCNNFLNATVDDDAAWNATVAACERMLTSGAREVAVSVVAVAAVLVASLQIAL